jgi:ABC-type transport system involved in multi-copper enzyme maturation permease subunit
MAAINSLRTFAAVVYNEMLLNSKRVAPYVMAMLCGGNALLWWGWGPATGRGWATNSDFFIAGVLPAFSFMTLPLFTAVIMADPVIRDFRAGVDSLIFSKPVSRAEYLLGKFCGSFFTLVCGQSAFVVTLFVLQWVPKHGMMVQEAKFFPYLKHFLFFVALSHLVLAAFYFTVGTLTRNAKIVYGLGVAFYPVYISYQIYLLKGLPSRWRTLLDPLLMNRRNLHMTSVEVINRLVVVYDQNEIGNRGVMILLTAICLAILYVRFTTTERSGTIEKFSVLNLSTAAERVYYPETLASFPDESFERPDYKAGTAIPEVNTVNEGIRDNLNKLSAALGVEFSLLRAERSLVVVMPVAILLSILEVAFYHILPDVSQSAAYATNTAKLLLLFLVGIAVFYTGEAMHRDREVKIEPVIWSTPVPNSVLLLSKFLTTVVLTVSLVIVVGLVAIVIQLLRGHTPVDVFAYVMVYGVVLVPGIIFVTALVVMLNVWLRNKYLAYVVAVGTGAGLFYLYSAGYNHWLYNPMLYQLWQYQDLVSGRILLYRLCGLTGAAACLALARLSFERRSP